LELAVVPLIEAGMSEVLRRIHSPDDPVRPQRRIRHASECPQTSLELLRAKIWRAAGRDAGGRAGAPWGHGRAETPSGGRACAVGPS